MHPQYSPQVIARFWAKVDRSNPDGCWLWTAALSKGYGNAWTGTRQIQAPRFAWILTHGEIPDGAQVLHDCPGGDDPRCCNPAHLWLGTNADNQRDAVRKGRHADVRGQRNGMAKLTEEQVRAIRAERAAGATLTAIAARYGVSFPLVSMICSRKVWYHVD